TTADYIRSLYIGYGSNCELETQVLLSGDLGYVEAGKLAELIEKIAEVERMLKALIKSLEKNTWPLESLNPRILVCLRQACLPCRQDFLQLIWRRTSF
ncbi:MAG: four helix bundle protein, partial [Desulfobacteria bacterium]